MECLVGALADCPDDGRRRHATEADDGFESPPVTGNLRRRLYGLSFIDEFGPVYAVYTLWFNDNGITTAQVSTLFLVWALISLTLEIPSGAVADRVDRRQLLAFAFVIRAAAITIWLVWPTLTGAFIGVALWASHDALASGSWEALIHDELTAVGAADRYGSIMARIGQFSHLGVALGTVLGAVLLRVDVGLATLGWLTVAAHAGSTALVATLPDVRWVTRAPAGDGADRSPDRADKPIDRNPDQAPSPLGEWWTTLLTGVAEARSNPVLARLVVVGALLEGLFLLDEYIPLLSRARGGSDDAAPLIVLVVWIGLLVGGEVAARRPALPGWLLGSALILAMAVTTAAFIGDRVWVLALVAVGYAALQTVWVTTDARLQERASGATRATVTSVRGFGSACVSMIMFAVIAALADGDDPTPGLFVMIAALVAAGLLIARWLPTPAPPAPIGGEGRPVGSA